MVTVTHLIPLLFGLFILQASAAPLSVYDNNAVINFSRKNAEKYRTEIYETKGISIGTKTHVLGIIDSPAMEAVEMSSLDLNYDVESGELIIGSSYPTALFLISNSCKTTGFFIGQNAYGAKAKIRGETCERFFIEDKTGFAGNIGGTRIKISPSQFRAIKKWGVKKELTFTVGVPNTDIPVDFLESVNSATIDNPVESHIKAWTVSGRIDEIKWLLPEDKTATSVWKRTVYNPN